MTAPNAVIIKEKVNLLSGTDLLIMYPISTVVRMEHLLNVKNLYHSLTIIQLSKLTVEY